VKRTVVWTAGLLAAVLAGHAARVEAQQPGTAAAPARATAEPRTRVAIINLLYVLKNYKKYDAFQAEMKDTFKRYDDQVRTMQLKIEALAKHAQDPKTTPEQREADEKEATNLKRQIEDINKETKVTLGKKSDDQMVILFREVQDAATRYAMAHNFDMVLHYTDAAVTADYYTAQNIARKIQSGGLMPLYWTRELDISYEVVNALNAHYQGTTQAAPAGARPSGN
jgi:Skp family chaperone for outer membrane proteins